MPKVIASVGQTTTSTIEGQTITLQTPKTQLLQTNVLLERKERRNVVKQSNAPISNKNTIKNETKIQKRQTGGITTQGTQVQQQRHLQQQKSGIKKPTTVTRK